MFYSSKRHTPDLLSRFANGQADPPVSRAQWELRRHSERNRDEKELNLTFTLLLCNPVFTRLENTSFQSFSDMSGHSGALLGPCFASFIALFCSLYPSQSLLAQEISLVWSKRLLPNKKKKRLFFSLLVYGATRAWKVSTYEVRFS